MNEKLAVSRSVLNPVEPHVNGFRPALFNGIVGYPGGTLVVSLNRCCELGMPEFRQGGTQRGGLFGVEKQGTNFCLSGRRHDGSDDAGMDVDCTIDRGRRGGDRWWLLGRCGAKEKIAARAGARVCFGQVGGIAVNVQAHITGGVADCGVRVGRAIVEQVIDGNIGGGSGFG